MAFRNRKIVLCSSLTSLSLILVVAGTMAVESFNETKDVKGDTGYSITLSGTENVLGSENIVTGKIATQSGYEISVYSGAYKKVDGAWGKILQGNVFNNTTIINGLESISLTLAASSDVKISWGTDGTTFGSYENFTGVSSLTSYFNYTAPGYFRVFATTEIAINSGTISYSCKPGITLKEFGSYPKTMLDENDSDDAFIIESLNTATGEVSTAADSHSWTNYGFYVNGVSSPYAWYNDASSGHDQYRDVYFSSYRPGATVSGSLSYTFNCQSDNGFSTGKRYWFKYEPLTWRVLSTKTEYNVTKLLLMSNYYIDSTHYYHSHEDHDNVHPYDYATSDIRTWLNNSFYSLAFTTTEENKISATSGEGTDKVSILTQTEATSSSYGFASDSSTADTKRQLLGTDYAKSLGLYVASGYGASYTRTPDTSLNNMYYQNHGIGNNGTANGDLDVSATCYGVAPLIWAAL